MRRLILILLASVLVCAAWAAAQPSSAQAVCRVAVTEDDRFWGSRVELESSTSRLGGTGDKASAAAIIACQAGRLAALHDEVNYRGICWNLEHREGVNEVWDFRTTYFPNDDLQSVAFDSRCGAQLILFQDDHYNAELDSGCQGIRCLAYLLGCTDEGEFHEDCAVEVEGEHRGVSVSDAFLSYGQTTNGSAVPWASESEFDSFGVTSLLMPDGGLAAVYDEKDFKGNCQELSFRHWAVDDLSDAGLEVGNDTINSMRLLRGCDDAIYLFSGPLGDRAPVAETTTDMPEIPGGRTALSLSNALRDTLVAAYSGPYFSGTCTVVPRTSSYTGLRHDTTIRSVRVGAACLPQPVPSVYLYPQTGYKGKPLVLEGSAPDLRTSNNNDLAYSLVNGGSAPISVYSDIQYGGACLEVPPTSGKANLAETFVGAGAISSVKFGPCPPAPVLHHGPPGWTVPVTLTADIPDVSRIVPPDRGVFSIVNKTPRTISLYNGTNYSGPCQNLAPGGELPLWIVLGLPPQVTSRDKLKSIKVSGPCPSAIQLFDHPNFEGEFRSIPGSRASLPTFAGRASSLVNNTNRRIAVYSNTNYRARCQTIEPGQWLYNLAGTVIGDNQITSIRFDYCRPRVLLFADPNYGGNFLGIAADTPNVSATGADSVANNVLPETVALYSGATYTGRCQNLRYGKGVPNLVGSVVGRPIRSIRVTRPCPETLNLYPNAGYGGAVRTETGPAPNLGVDAVGSVVNNGRGTWALYTAVKWLGTCVEIPPDGTITDVRASGQLGQVVSAKPGGC